MNIKKDYEDVKVAYRKEKDNNKDLHIRYDQLQKKIEDI